VTDLNNRRFSDTHVWVRQVDDHLLLGITDYAQNALGTLEAIVLPEIGARIEQGQVCGCLESLKTVSDLIAPLNATVSAHNPDVAGDPTLVNDHPYEAGWLLELRDYAADAYTALLDVDGYQQLIAN